MVLCICTCKYVHVVLGVVTGYYLVSGLEVAVKVSAEVDGVRKLRFVMLEMETWGREPLGCSSNLTT